MDSLQETTIFSLMKSKEFSCNGSLRDSLQETTIFSLMKSKVFSCNGSLMDSLHVIRKFH